MKYCRYILKGELRTTVLLRQREITSDDASTDSSVQNIVYVIPRMLLYSETVSHLRMPTDNPCVTLRSVLDVSIHGGFFILTSIFHGFSSSIINALHYYTVSQKHSTTDAFTTFTDVARFSVFFYCRNFHNIFYKTCVILSSTP